MPRTDGTLNFRRQPKVSSKTRKSKVVGESPADISLEKRS